MNRLVVLCLILCAWLPARASTNAPTVGLMLDEKTAFELTAGLEQYKNPARFTGKFTSRGGESCVILVNRWAGEFETIYPDVTIESRSGGIGVGLAGLIDGTVDLVPAARALRADEVAQFKAKFGYEPVQIIIAQDALGIYVNKNNPVKGLTLTQLDAIYSRDAKRGGGRPEFWGDLGVTGPMAEQRISRASVSSVHSSHVFFKDYVLQGAEYRFDVRFEPVPGSLVQAVAADEAAVGFTSVMLATARTRFVPLQADDGSYVLPSYENTLSGKYPLVRPMWIAFHKKPDGGMNPAAREFLRFAVSRRGQRIISLAGSYPLTVEQQGKALEAIGASQMK